MPNTITEEILEKKPSVAIRLTGADDGFRTIFVTENISFYGYSREDFLSGKIKWTDIVHPDDLDKVKQVAQENLDAGIDHFNVVYRIKKADGTDLWVTDTTITERDENGGVLYYDCIMQDYSQVQLNFEKIKKDQEQQSVLNDILQEMRDKNPDKVIQTIFEKAGSYAGISRIVLFENMDDLAQCEAIYEWVRNSDFSLMNRQNGIFYYETDFPEVKDILSGTDPLIIHSDRVLPIGSARFSLGNTTASIVFPIGFQEETFGFLCFDECEKKRKWDKDTVVFFENIAHLVTSMLLRRQNKQEIASLALTDQLTGLYNRQYLKKRLNLAIAQARKKNKKGYVLFIDMDDFKIINDGYGHDFGDAILKDFAVFLTDEFSSQAEIFRFGGDEFVILLSPENADSLQYFIDQLQTRSQLPWIAKGKDFYCTLSIGVVSFPEKGMNAKEVLQHADIAMYQAKTAGKNNYVLYTSPQDQSSIDRAELERLMREAIENHFDGFTVLYQPQVDGKGAVIGAEALLRWKKQDGKQMLPEQFIPLAEYLGLIVPLGEFVLRESAKICKWVNETYPHFWISINVSIRQFRDPDFFDQVMSIMKEVGVNLGNIIFEITEGMAVYDMDQLKSVSENFRKKGIRISMDDFGTGYSSLSNMRDLPIDIVKIDKSFIRDITTDHYSKSFVQLIIDLVHSMGRKVCVEGVETEAQLEYCRSFNADYVQGFHLHEPIPLEAFKKMIQSS